MTVHVCDICGRRMTDWYVVGADSDNMDYRRLLRDGSSFRMEICKDCFMKKMPSVFVKEDFLP